MNKLEMAKYLVSLPDEELYFADGDCGQVEHQVGESRYSDDGVVFFLVRDDEGDEIIYEEVEVFSDEFGDEAYWNQNSKTLTALYAQVREAALDIIDRNRRSLGNGRER